MTSVTDGDTNRTAVVSAAHALLQGTGMLWFLVAVAGQIMFAAHVFLFYGGNAAAGNLEAWNKRLIHGIIEGDPIGNLAVMVHIFFAFVITVGGPLQLIPQVRAWAPVFHHWNGRVYLLTAVIMACGGLFMVWTRGALGGLPNALGISLNAILILTFAAFAVRHAIARNIDTHRRWALRLFLAVSGVWFLRIWYMAWVILNKGPVGMEDNLDGWFDRLIFILSFIVPLVVLQLYLRAQDSPSATTKLGMAVIVLGLTALTALGVFGTVALMWRKDFLFLLPA
jgi:hypothetical protein